MDVAHGESQGRALTAGDQLALGDCAYVVSDVPSTLTISLRPAYPSHWTIYCLAGPHCDEEFLTTEGIRAFFDTHWKVSASSNRMGIRLEGSRLAWARATGGEGGSHPSNIHDTGYALGTVNVNGDTPVILTNEGPDMGGYVCLCTVASAELCVNLFVSISFLLNENWPAGSWDNCARATPSISNAYRSTRRWSSPPRRSSTSTTSRSRAR